ncbi:MAG: histone deacetylase family protein [Gemmatimonadota bacterium]
MIRIRRIYDDVHPRDRAVLAQVRDILRTQFPGLPEETVAALPDQLRNPLAAQFRTILFAADDGQGTVRGFALLRHAADLRFCYLDFISAVRGGTGGGVGGALYQQVRAEARALDCVGIFMESLPDDPALSPDPDTRRQNAARLRFYERFGVRPLANTAYETPLRPGDSNPPYLLFDDLGLDRPLPRATARAIVRAILERRYAGVCPPEYVQRVVASISDDPVRLREPRYTRKEEVPVEAPARPIALVVNEGHAIHHVKERGYVEAPVRISAILRSLDASGLFQRLPAARYPESAITAVHDPAYVRYLKRVCQGLAAADSVYPYVFPIRNAARPPRDLAIQAGYYCIDTFTPLNGNAFAAARGAVDCALTAADRVLAGAWLAYALVRPPGHHAERRAFGGFCYFNSAAVAAHALAAHGPVAVLDVDYHHGNGQQDIFWTRDDVFTVSIHGNPAFAYPYFSGFRDERGSGSGAGCNLNLPLPEHVDGSRYLRELRQALGAVREFAPRFLVVALGLDPARADPTGTWSLERADFRANGEAIGALGLPTLVVQEGGYRTRTLGGHARAFFTGLWHGAHAARAAVP